VSNQKNAVTLPPAVETPATTYAEAAQAFVEQLRGMRATIPHFTIPSGKGARERLNSLASLPPEFLELTSVARTNHAALVRGEETTPAEARDLVSYADAYAPVADELEALAQFVRFSIAAAKAKVGAEALTTYSLARRLARRQQHADLAPHVADMRRALGNRFKRPKADPAKKQGAAAPPTPPSEKK